ncbi:MAG TPA: PfkB family carbohydrate kinase [Candidatus Acidoferrales bacterium]|nr:PfkB family carbohydrate kinase [Candidatus Acidoferrales bacterium]
MFDLVGIGNPVYDSIVTPLSKTKGRVLSGCSTNACLASKRLGSHRVGLVGSVGPDYATRFRDDMRRYGIEAKVDATSKETGGFHLVYDSRGDRTLDVLGVARSITKDNFSPEFLQSRFTLIGPILGEVDLPLIQFLRSSTSSRLFLDPQGLVRSIGSDKRVIHECDVEEFRRIANLVDFVKPNEHESETITQEVDPLLALRRLSQMGARVPIITLAERGSLLLDGDRLHRIPAYPTEALDPTGAGDVYAGSFITELQRCGDLVEAALFASAAASIMVEQVGPDFRLVRKEVDERKEAIRDRLITETFY